MPLTNADLVIADVGEITLDNVAALGIEEEGDVQRMNFTVSFRLKTGKSVAAWKGPGVTLASSVPFEPDQTWSETEGAIADRVLEILATVGRLSRDRLLQGFADARKAPPPFQYVPPPKEDP